jgi:hypothetical protein
MDHLNNVKAYSKCTNYLSPTIKQTSDMSRLTKQEYQLAVTYH